MPLRSRSHSPITAPVNMTESKSEPVPSDDAKQSDENPEKRTEEIVSAPENDASYSSKYFESNEGYWKNSNDAEDSSDDDLPLARRDTGRTAESTTMHPERSQPSALEPRRRRRGGPPEWESAQLYQGKEMNHPLTTPPTHSRTYDPFHIHQDEAVPESDEEMARRLQNHFQYEDLDRAVPTSSHGMSRRDPPAVRTPTEDKKAETDEEVARRLQDQFSREAELSGAVSHDTYGTAGPVSAAGVEMGGLPMDRDFDAVKYEGQGEPVRMQNIPQQHPETKALRMHNDCWEDRFEHLPFRSSCSLCNVEQIPCSKHHPSSGYCYQHGLPRMYAPVFDHVTGLDDVYERWYEDLRREGSEDLRRNRSKDLGHSMSQSSGVRKRVIKARPPKVVPPKMEEAILRELRSKDDERDPPTV